MDFSYTALFYNVFLSPFLNYDWNFPMDIPMMYPALVDHPRNRKLGASRWGDRMTSHDIPSCHADMSSHGTSHPIPSVVYSWDR